MSQPSLDEIASRLDAGDVDAAREALEAMASPETEDAGLHLRIADLAQAAGAGVRLLASLGEAHRIDPENLLVIRRLAQAHEDAGSADKALRLWRTLTERAPSDVAAWDAYGMLLAENGRAEESRLVFSQALQATGDRRFRALERNVQRQGEPDDLPLPSEALLVRFVSLFEGREGVYARQWTSDQGATGYTPIREPFTVNVARNHLLGNHTVGIYPMRLDNTVNFGAIDFDLPKAFVERSAPGRADWNQAIGQMMQYVERLCELARERGIAVHVEDSGWKGLHCWVFAASPLPAVAMRKLLDTLLGITGPTPVGVTTEVFPKQNTLPLDKLGNLIKLPMGVHRRTGRRAVWVDGHGVHIDDQSQYLLQSRRVDPDAIHRFLETHTTPAPLEVSTRDSREMTDDGHDDDAPPFEATGTAIARAEPYLPENDLEYVTVTTHCAVVRELVRKADTERRLSHDEAMVLVHSIGHLANGPRAVNAVLARCPGSDESLRLKSRLKGNPMSCGRVRARIPHVTAAVGCNCPFEVGAGSYPNPLLHLAGADTEGTHRLQSLRLDGLIQDFLKARKGLHDANAFFHDSCARLARYFEEAGVDEMVTPFGRLQRFEEDGRSLFRLDV